MKDKINKILLYLFLAWLPLGLSAQDPEAKVLKKGISVGAQNQKSQFGGFVNIAGLEVLDLQTANGSPQDIDFVYTYGQKTKINILTPSSPSMGSFGATYKAASGEWEQKNRGSLIFVENNKENRKLYRGVKRNKDLEAAYEKAIDAVKEVSDYKRTIHGPNTRIRELSIGDYFIFRSNDGRGYAMGRIVDYKAGYQGHIRIDVLATNNKK